MPEIETLTALVERDAALPVSEEVTALADAIQKRGKVAAVLYYGSGLWKEATADTIHDFYAIVDRYHDFDQSRIIACLGTLLPPNVYYLETQQGQTLRAKVAVITHKQFSRMTRGRTPTPQIWARFAQPCRLVYAKDSAIHNQIISDLTAAVVSFHRHTLPLVTADAAPEVIWRRGLADTYAAELRPEQTDRTAALFSANRDSFIERTELAHAIIQQQTGQSPVWLPIPLLKGLAFLRLLKGTLTFSGGVDYILWKVARQSGVQLTATPRQKKYPLLFAWPLVWQLYRRGGFR